MSDGKRNHRKAEHRDINKYYQFSSEAYELANEEQRKSRVRVVRRGIKLTDKQRRKMIKQRKMPTYVYEEKPERKLSLPTIACAVVLFISAFSYLLTYSLISVGEKEIAILENQITELENNNIALQNEIYEDYDLTHIEKVATKKLGMNKPEEHQIIYISPPKNNYFVNSNIQESETETKNLFQLLFK